MYLLPVLVRCIGRSGLVWYLLPASLSLAFSSLGAAPAAGPHSVEVFTTAQVEVTGPAASGRLPSGIELPVYRLDGIQQVEWTLSADLPGDPAAAKRIAMTRLQQIDGSARERMQHAAVGLIRAIEYGIDRYPAVVFDAEVVVYGVTDLGVALDHYQAWRAGAQPR